MKDCINLVLPESLENRRIEFEGYIDNARKRVSAFAKKFGWEEHAQKPFMNEVRIFNDKKKFNSELASLAEIVPEFELPDTYCAALEKGVLTAMTPEFYAVVYPEGIEDSSYEKLLAHEIAHRLHIRILNGDEDAMGPVWFFEGFAIFAADQLRSDGLFLSKNEIIEIVDNPDRGSYKNYAHVFRLFLSIISLKELLFNAGKPDFNKWIKNNLISVD
ncbi:hypothetical protein JXL83_00765 [candidate division WOR-3 bacterium]|nr:hypothetical protein [candidate division WOR-3 bacterium]